MNDLQRQNLLKQLDRLLAQAETDAEFDALDDARSAVKKWDLQGAIPREAELRAWGIDLEAALSTPDEAATTPVAEPVISEGEAQQISRALRKRIAANDPDADTQRAARKALKAWRAAGRLDPLPHAGELASWGIWPPAPAPEPSLVTPPPEPAAPDPDAALIPEYQTARSLIAAQPYQAIQRLVALQPRAQGRLVEKISAHLAEARVELQRRTEALLIAARRVQREQPKDLAAQAEAWRAVTSLNPESLEAQESLQKLQQRARQAVEEEMQGIEKDARAAADRDHLPDLNEARGAAEALVARTDLPGDLVEPAQVLKDKVLALLAATRDRLGVASTKKVEGDLRESYLLARESLEKGIPQLVDTEGVLGLDGDEVPTGEFFRVISGDFLAATGKKAEERLASARAIERGAPDAALEWLAEARGWLTDEVWTSSHRGSLRPQLEEVVREIEDVNRLLKHFEEAREKVTEARASGLAVRERLQLLNEAQQLYPDYPNIGAYLDDARDNLAGGLAGEVAAQIAEAHRQTLQELFPESLATLRQARTDALRDVPEPKPGSRLAQALARVAQEEATVAQAEQSLRDLESLLAQVDAKLAAYDEDKKDLLSLNEARALLDQVSETQRQHPKTQAARSRVAAQQGEAENYGAGKGAYSRRDWAGAHDYFDKVTAAFAQYTEAQQLSKRAQAALAAEKAQQAEVDKQWKVALESYIQAVYLFKEAGDDGLTGSIAAACREAKQRIEENDQRFRLPLEGAQKRLTQAQQSVSGVQSPLRDRLDPIAEFKAIIQELEPLIQTPSALGEDIKTTLRLAREAWRQAYLPALQTAAAATLSEALLAVACQRAEELKSVGLLYSQEEELLYYQLRGKQLDQAYTRLHEAEAPDWAVIEQNRRARLDLLVAAKSEEHQRQWAEAHQKCLEGEIRALREQEGVMAAQEFLGKQVRSGKLRAEAHWLRLWLELCWEARNWDEAEHVAQRLADIAPDPQTRRMKAMLWLGLTRAACAYAEDDIEGARSRLEAVRQQSYDDVLDEIEEMLEQQTLQRLLNTAAQERRALRKSGSAASPEQYFAVARAYGLALQLFPDHPEATQGLNVISNRIEPVLKQRCQEVEVSRILRQDLAAACASANRLLSDLKALEAIVGHLTISASEKSELAAALETQQKKKERWDRATTRLKLFEQAVVEALSCPDAPRLDDLEHSGGWDFSAARVVLVSLRREAIKARDRGMQDLIAAELRRLDGYEEAAREVMQRVRVLLQAIVDEQFEAVVSAVKALEILWKQVTVQEPAWDGLEALISYLYRYPTQEVHTLREHRECALKQQANLHAWDLYEKNVSSPYNSLIALEKELLDGEFDMLKFELSLRDIQEQCVIWERYCDDFLKNLERRAPQELPLSAKAEEIQAKAALEMRKTHLNGEGGTRARIADLKVVAQEAEEKFKWCFQRFLRSYNGLPSRIKNRRRSIGPKQSDLARRLYQECRQHDPMNVDLKRLRKQLEDLGVTF